MVMLSLDRALTRTTHPATGDDGSATSTAAHTLPGEWAAVSFCHGDGLIQWGYASRMAAGR